VVQCGRPAPEGWSEFESVEEAKGWSAAEYAATSPFRQQSAESTLILVEGVRISGPAPHAR
jgi:uncharacterized protein (DUF1330 family)